MFKEKFDKKPITLLESNPDFVDEVRELHRANFRDRAWKLDHDLIKLLFTDKEVEAKFFNTLPSNPHALACAWAKRTTLSFGTAEKAKQVKGLRAK